jgi:hypothetical protein
MKIRCAKCKKHTHLEFKCACGSTYCVKCRAPEEHGCQLDPATVLLIKVVAEKVNKI